MTARVAGLAMVAIAALTGCALDLGGVDGPDAQLACEEFVEDQLGTAEFSEQTESGAGSTWTASGTVESENRSGKRVRSTYTCDLRYRAALQSWRLVDVWIEVR